MRRTPCNAKIAKPWLLRRPFLGRRRLLVCAYLFAGIGLLHVIRTLHRAGYLSLKAWFHDPLWSYEYVNASASAFPPHDPTYVVFEPPPKFEPEFVPAHRPLEAVRQLPSRCLDDYFAKGVLCHTGPDPPLDVVWTWVNGSERLLQESMGRVTRTTSPKMSSILRTQGRLFHDHDELRHSLRSVLKHFRGSTTQLYIVTSDFEIPIPVMDGERHINGTRRLGLVPSWLDPERAAEWRDGNVGLRMIFHSEIFRAYNGPSFNSYGIESQLIHINGLSNNFIYMNDDFFMMKNLSASDFYTSAYGIVLRMQVDLMVENRENPLGRLDGEWGPLEYTNWCLSKRFGSRLRPYTTHSAKTVSLSLQKEFSRMWHSELTVTASHPFRGMKTVHRDIYSLFLFSHSVVERWREGLLWSWVVAKLGGIDDEWRPQEREHAWLDIGGEPGGANVVVLASRRTTLQEDVLRNNLRDAGHVASKQTRYVFASADGYPYGYRNENGTRSWLSFASADEHLCTIDYEACFGKMGIHTASEFFKHIAFEQPQLCGDCIIHALRGASGDSGLSAFLPEPIRQVRPQRDQHNTRTFSDQPHLPMTSDWHQSDFTLKTIIREADPVNVREWTLRMLERYRFVIGITPTGFHAITSAPSAQVALKRVNEDKDMALLCLNDNSGGPSHALNTVLQKWQEKRWGLKAAWER